MKNDLISIVTLLFDGISMVSYLIHYAVLVGGGKNKFVSQQ